MITACLSGECVTACSCYDMSTERSGDLPAFTAGQAVQITGDVGAMHHGIAPNTIGVVICRDRDLGGPVTYTVRVWHTEHHKFLDFYVDVRDLREVPIS